jgi:hypothetical protein
MDPDPDPVIFVIDPQDVNKKLILFLNKIAYYFLKVHLHHFSKIRSQKVSQNSRNQGFSYYFCMIIEGNVDPVDPVGNSMVNIICNLMVFFVTCHL